MKTFNTISNKIYSYIFLLVLGLLTVSCISYRSTSYRDSDGIYSRPKTQQPTAQNTNPNTNQTAKSKSYFSDFPRYDVPENEEPVGIFTDVDEYYGEQGVSTGYSGWGNNTTEVTVNVYGGYGYYGPSWYIGWGNPYWSSWRNPYYWGYGWNSWHNPYWGYGWNSWHNPYWGYGYYGGYYPYYGYHRYNTAYYRGSRGGYYAPSDYYAHRGGNTAYRTNRNNNAATNNSRTYQVQGRNQNGVQNSSKVAPGSNFSRGGLNMQSRNETIGNRNGIDASLNRNKATTRGANQVGGSNTNYSRNTIDNSTRNTTTNQSRNNTYNNSNRNNNYNNSTNPSGNYNRSSSTPPTMSRGGGSVGGGSRSSGSGSGGGRSSGGRR